MLIAYRKQHERANQQAREIEKLMKDISDTLGRSSLAQGQAEILCQRLNQMTGVAEKAALQVAKVNAKKKRKPNVRKIRAFVATANADGWDPSNWDRNIWDSDD